MKIELKKIQFSEALSEETNAFMADLYINGKKVGYCKNTGQGGCTDYYSDKPEHRQVIAEAEAYFNSLPKYVPKGYDFELQPTLEGAIDDQLDNWLKAKDQKKMEKKMQTGILVGRPNGMSYSYYNFKRPLSEIPLSQLAASLSRITDKLKAGEVILNTNLDALGIHV